LLEKAESFAREAVALAEPVDWYMQRVEAHMTLAHVLAAAGSYEDASASARKALALENRKGDVATAKATRAFLADLPTPARRVAHRRSARTQTA
jgi:tetratricopeptide (TPR) repeat protein